MGRINLKPGYTRLVLEEKNETELRISLNHAAPQRLVRVLVA